MKEVIIIKASIKLILGARKTGVVRKVPLEGGVRTVFYF